MPRQTEPFSEADLLSAGATCYIYTLHASNDPECRPRYVGFTCRLKRREIEHNTGGEQGRKGAWVRSLRSTGARVILTAIYTFRSDSISERAMVEATWVELYQNRFSDLLNDAGAGSGVAPCSEALRQRRKVMNLGRKHSKETRAKVAASKIGKKRPPEVIEALRRANLGRKFSAERCAKMSEMAKGRKHSPETLEKMRKNTKGRKMPLNAVRALRWHNFEKKLTPEHRAKISAGGMGRKNSPESIARAASKIRGQKRTPEQLERLKIAAQKRAANPEYRKACSAGQKRRFAKGL